MWTPRDRYQCRWQFGDCAGRRHGISLAAPTEDTLIRQCSALRPRDRVRWAAIGQIAAQAIRKLVPADPVDAFASKLSGNCSHCAHSDTELIQNLLTRSVHSNFDAVSQCPCKIETHRRCQGAASRVSEPKKRRRIRSARFDRRAVGGARNSLPGKVFSHTAPCHRHQEWLAFLRKIDKEVAPELELHIICDNYSTHKHAKVTAWLKRHPRFHLHFIPTSSSWLNLVERFFGEITAKVIRPGSFNVRGLDRRHLPLSRLSQSQSQTLSLDCRPQAHPGKARSRVGGHAPRNT